MSKLLPPDRTYAVPMSGEVRTDTNGSTWLYLSIGTALIGIPVTDQMTEGESRIAHNVSILTDKADALALLTD